MEAWNANRGKLPEVQETNEGRKKAVARLVRDCGGDVGRAVQLVSEATREVALDEFWQTHRYGFDNLVPSKVLARAEAWRARNVQTTPTNASPEQAASTSAYQVGDRVTYKRESYTVEAITDTYIDLYDDKNGSTRIYLASNDWNALHLKEVRHVE